MQKIGCEFAVARAVLHLCHDNIIFYKIISNSQDNSRPSISNIAEERLE